MLRFFARDDGLLALAAASRLASVVVVIVDCRVRRNDQTQKKNMSQSLRAIKRFRIRELALASSPKISRIPPAATAASNLHTSEESSRPSRSGTGGGTPNPFLPHKNFESGLWAPPRYSLRRQADLIKHARASGTVHLLPPGPKMSPAAQQQLLLAVTTATTTTTTTLSSSGLGKGRVEVEEKAVRSGLVSMRRGEEVQEREQEQEQGLGVGQGQGQGQGQEAVETAAGEVAQGEALVPEQNSLQAQAADWTIPVEWTGMVRERNVAGADIGNRLYAGKKRMFKGHKWERTRERRVGRTNMLLRDMDKRIERFKGVRLHSSSDHSSSPPLFSKSSFADGVFPFCAF